jgi:hypothetical protein
MGQFPAFLDALACSNHRDGIGDNAAHGAISRPLPGAGPDGFDRPQTGAVRKMQEHDSTNGGRRALFALDAVCGIFPRSS